MRLQVHDWGGTGDGLVFVHGMQDSPHSFDDLAPLFRDRYHVVAYARRAHGQSDATGPYDTGTLTDDLTRVIDSLSLGRAALIGWSMGGNEVTEFAVRYPERVARLVLLDCYDWGDPAKAHAFESWPVAIDAEPTPQDRVSAAALRTWMKSFAWADTASSPAMEAELLDVVEMTADWGAQLRPSGDVQAALSKGLRAYHPRYDAIKAPILAIFGRWYTGMFLPRSRPDAEQQMLARFLDGYVHPWQDAAVARLRAQAPAATVVVIDPANHGTLPFRNTPGHDKIVEAMRAFLGSGS